MTTATGFTSKGLFRLLLEGPGLDRLARRRVGRGETLIVAGTSADEMYLVETGRFRVERDGVELAEIGVEGVLGEIAFLTGKPRTADVIAARDSVVLRITQEDFAALCADQPDLPRAIAAELADRLAETSARVPHDPSRPPARTFVILPAAQAPLPATFISALADAIRPHRSVRVVTEAHMKEALGATADPDSGDAVNWLNMQEREAEIVLFVATPDATPWSRAVIRQADQAVFVAQGVRFTRPSEIEEVALNLLPETQRRLVLIHPHRMQHAIGTAEWLDSRPVFLHHHVALTEDGADMARLGRFIAGRAIGMVMSGGGAFGLAHVGIWRAMEDLGLPVDIMGGTSVGSAMAGAMALGVPAEDIGPRVEQIFVRSGAMRRVTLPRYSFLDHTVLDAALYEHYSEKPIEDLWLPFYAVAADLSTMSKRVIRRGPLWEAVRASSAIPGVLPAFFTSEGEMLVDGGCVDNMPFLDMHALKSGPNVVVNVQKVTNTQFHVDYGSLPGRGELLRRTMLPFGKKPPRAPGVVSTVMRSLLVGQADLLSGLNPDDLHIRPPGLKGAGFLAWNQHKLFYEIAYKHGTDLFADLKTSDDTAMRALREAGGL